MLRRRIGSLLAQEEDEWTREEKDAAMERATQAFMRKFRVDLVREKGEGETEEILEQEYQVLGLITSPVPTFIVQGWFGIQKDSGWCSFAVLIFEDNNLNINPKKSIWSFYDGRKWDDLTWDDAGY